MVRAAQDGGGKDVAAGGISRRTRLTVATKGNVIVIREKDEKQSVIGVNETPRTPVVLDVTILAFNVLEKRYSLVFVPPRYRPRFPTFSPGIRDDTP